MIRHLHPEYYPRDAPLIDSQARLTVADEAIASIARVTRASLPALFVVLYAGSLVLLAFAAIALGRIYFRTQLATLTLFAGLTMRHAIAKTGTNTLEGYFHPRQLAFALGRMGRRQLSPRPRRPRDALHRRRRTRPSHNRAVVRGLAGGSVRCRQSPAGRARRRHSPRGLRNCRLGADGGATRRQAAQDGSGVAGDPSCRRTTSSLSSGRGRCG